jgi:hypothetical protein
MGVDGGGGGVHERPLLGKTFEINRENPVTEKIYEIDREHFLENDPFPIQNPGDVL